MSEFDLIRTYFADVGCARADVTLGVGDDCALLEVPEGRCLAVSIDTLTAGTHFFTACDAASVGHKSLAVGLSDLAAMGAEPAWATLALTLPERNDAWLRAFASGFAALANAHRVRLVGGDTTRGPLSVTVQVHGLLPIGSAIRRGGARPGDLIYVSGTLGDAGLALRGLLSGSSIDPVLRSRLEWPIPRVELGLRLRGIATAMIDLSDGLAGDLSHILMASGVGADLELGRLPLSPAVAEVVEQAGDWSLPLSAGDDYELCFCIPPERAGEMQMIAAQVDCPLAGVGRIRQEPGLFCLSPSGVGFSPGQGGYDHFVT